MNVSLVRPYLMTAGRAEPENEPIEIEAQVLTSQLGMASYDALTFEHRDIVALCRTTRGRRRDSRTARAAHRCRQGPGRRPRGERLCRRPASRNDTLVNDLDIIERVIRGLEAIR